MEMMGKEYLETLSQALHKVQQTSHTLGKMVAGTPLGKMVAGTPNPPEMERLC
jgi:hypothetical protein